MKPCKNSWERWTCCTMPLIHYRTSSRVKLVSWSKNVFVSCSDRHNLVILEEMQKQFTATVSQLQDRVAKLEGSIALLESQVPQMDGKRRQLQETSERRFLSIQETCSKLELALYESQAELALVKNASDDLMTREREAAHLQKSLQISQEDAMDALKKLREESSQLQVELFALKQQTNAQCSYVYGCK
ncbi:Hypothetical protein PHPALM_17328 [Phytophthora palmivora]|uniref:Uncharacterized protein n=1 Tax=Phytophthora palmivora TaxID=4796 RepID=A0A2P4XMM9_9STRA|nr:Hypothetical protein PHPALM_17328 [Phytophthora palmivora]